MACSTPGLKLDKGRIRTKCVLVQSVQMAMSYFINLFTLQLSIGLFPFSLVQHQADSRP